MHTRSNDSHEMCLALKWISWNHVHASGRNFDTKKGEFKGSKQRPAGLRLAYRKDFAFKLEHF